MENNSKWKIFSSPQPVHKSADAAAAAPTQASPTTAAPASPPPAAPPQAEQPSGPAAGECPVPDTGYLQLYLDNDYMLPIAVGHDGSTVRYSEKDGNARLWLYFAKDSGKYPYKSGGEQRANFLARREGSLGDFWENLAAGQKVPGESYGYADLLELTGMMDRLRDWTRVILRNERPAVVLNFATTIDVKARMAFVAYLAQKGMEVRSYSIELNELLAMKVVSDMSGLQLSFGRQMLILQSVGSRLLLSGTTWCGNAFMQGEMPVELSMEGENFRKSHLAKMAVERMEQQMHMLTQSEVKQEVAYQAQFAEHWLKSRENNVIWIDGFHYSMNPTKRYMPFSVNAAELDIAVAADMQTVTDRVCKYYKENISSHLYTVMVGDAFRDEIFMDHCIKVTESENGKARFFTDIDVQEAMARYFALYGTLEENPAMLEHRYVTIAQERQRIRQYVKNAEKMAAMRTAIAAARKRMEEAVDAVKAMRADKEGAWEAHMKQSRFDEAEKVIGEMGACEALTVALRQLAQTIDTVEASTSLLADLARAEQPQVRKMVEEINGGLQQMRRDKEQAALLDELPARLRQRTQHYRDCYATYLELKNELNREPSLGGKRRVLARMTKDENGNLRDLTMETLPSVDVETVTAQLTCEVVKERAGLFKTKYSLKITLQLSAGAALPVPCVLMVGSTHQIGVDRSGWNTDLNAGISHYETTIAQEQLPPSPQKRYVVQLFPDEQHAYLTRAVYCEDQQVQLR